MKLLIEDLEDRVERILAVLFRGGDRRGLLLALGALARVGEEVRVARLFDLDGLGLFLVKAGGDDGNDDLVIERIVKKMEEDAEGGLDYSGKCYISNSACYEDAKAVADLVEARFKNLNGKVVINSIGTTIGSHTGPGTVALFFFGKKREN